MLRDFKFLRRNSGKHNDETENVPVNPRDSLVNEGSSDSSSRPPLNTIQEPTPRSNSNPRSEREFPGRTRIDRTPTKPKPRSSDPTLPMRTPDKHGALAKNRFGWAQRNESNSIPNESREDVGNYSFHPSRAGLPSMTPRSTRNGGKALSSHSECSSTQSTPTKSVSKPPSSGFRAKNDGNSGGGRVGNFAALYRGVPVSAGPSTAVVNTVEVPHFEIREDPSFWMDHNVQVLIRVRPLNSMERTLHGYVRCLKQESAQSITWIGQPETRFTFDHVACETVDQEMLFRMAGLPMVENCLSGYNSCMFAYGQTGSGKTYTMLGEIDNLQIKPSPHRGMTPRIFEFLFARIQAEEESRRDEKLTYNCKCSFLEIYNEQITDLLDPSSANLLLREDVKKGVYVENLSEFEVQSVNDILKLLTQGSLNRKVAATNMNRESSRSHSVFTCVIESRWEKDSATNLRFARLNLVDLAGSERQKSSGADGERLKEAANINKSLSTLGHVIMILVDVANGKPRHVPYRDSRLTFLLQDSLGGNSKTMIVANVSPSISCAAETLNTLKFAQRAKLIQNNAVVNEDSTGDVIALQHQIRLLKEELSILKRQNVSRSLSFGSTVSDTTPVQEHVCMDKMQDLDGHQLNDLREFESKGIFRMSTQQLKSLETTLTGALRREQMAEISIKKLEAEIEQLNRLVRQREEDTRSTKMMLKFREDKIQRMESLVGDSLPAETYLLEENRALCEEIQLLQSKVDKNPEVTRFALENIRLLEQLRRFQEFYEEGEREILLNEVSNLREQLLQVLDGKAMQHSHSKLNGQPQLMNTVKEPDECRIDLDSCLEENRQLSREIHNLHGILENIKSANHDHDCNIKTVQDSLEGQTTGFSMCKGAQTEVEGIHATSMMGQAEEVLDLHLELDILKIILKEERSSHAKLEETTLRLNRDLELAEENFLSLSKQYEAAAQGLKEAELVVEALESQQLLALNEIEDLRKNNSKYVKLLREKELEVVDLKEQHYRQGSGDLMFNHLKADDSILHSKLMRMQDSLEKTKRLNKLYRSDCALRESNEEMDEVCRQAEAETAEVIVCLQEELSVLQQQVQEFHLKERDAEDTTHEMQEKLHLLTEENRQLQGKADEKEGELRTLCEEWELLACGLEKLLANGEGALTDACDQLDLISSSFTQKRIWISEQVGLLSRNLSQKELLIEELRKCLEEANNKRSDLDFMLQSLRGAALMIGEVHQQEYNEKEKEILLLKSQLGAKTSTIAELGDKLKLAEYHASNASHSATVAFVIVNHLSEVNLNNHNTLKSKDIQIIELEEINYRKEALVCDQAAAIKQAKEEILCLKMDLVDSKELCSKLHQRLSEEEQHASSMKQKLEDIEKNDILKTREKLAELKTVVLSLRSCMGIKEEYDRSPEMTESEASSAPADGSDLWTDVGEDMRIGNPVFSLKTAKRSHDSSCDHKDNAFRRTSKDKSDRDVTIMLLKKEIESALVSLQDVRVEMEKLCNEKEAMEISEKQREERMKCFTTQMHELQAAIHDFEKQIQLRMKAVNYKVQVLEQAVKEAGACWCQTKEVLEMEVGDVKIVAAQKTAEASCFLSKFEEAQYAMKEADIMINELVIANETMKLEIEKLKKLGVTLTGEKDVLINEVQSLQSVIDFKQGQLEELEEDFRLNLMETRDAEAMIIEVQNSFMESFMSIACEFNCFKALFSKSRKLMRSWLEDIWSEIIVKDCAVSVLHLCHMGILLETVTGLNAENGLLQHGLCESNSLIANLREHNSKSSRELQMCRNLKGKLLADIKSSFHRILRKEEETGELGVKLTDFEKKINDLQLQEELMLQRSNHMGSQLAILMKELDYNNANIVESLFDKEKTLKETEELLNSQAEMFKMNLCSKDFESLVLASQLEEIAFQKVLTEKQHGNCGALLENLKKEIIFSLVDAELKEKVLVSKEAQVDLLQKDLKDAEKDTQDLISRFNQRETKIREMDDLSQALQQEVQLLRDVASANIALKEEIGESMGTKVMLLGQVEALQAECDDLHKDLKTKNIALEYSSSQISALEQQNQNLQKDIHLLETSRSELQCEMDIKDTGLSRMSCLEEENKSLKDEIKKLKSESTLVLEDLRKQNSAVESSLTHVGSLEAYIASLEAELQAKNAEMSELLSSQSVVMADLCSKSQDLQIFVRKVSTLKEENICLRNELGSQEKATYEAMIRSRSNILRCVDLVENVQTRGQRMFNALDKGRFVVSNNMLADICENMRSTSKFIEEIEFLELHVKELEYKNINLQTELLRKDDILKGLLFDLSLLQESASDSKDCKDKVTELAASSEALEAELFIKSDELDKVVTHNQLLQDQLWEKMDLISTLESDLVKECELRKECCCENMELKAEIEEVVNAKYSLQEELEERRNLAESLEMELSQMGNVFSQLTSTIESLKYDFNELAIEKDQLILEIHNLRKELQMTHARAKENEAIAIEAQQIAESRGMHAEDKEAEVKLLERSVEELECTVNVLENKVDILKGEAERQRMQREELEAELHALNHQIQNVKSADTDVTRDLEEKVEALEQALKHIKILEKDTADRESEISQLKAHISELNLHAEAQANEYKKKFKALEATVEQVKPEGHFSHVANSSLNKSEKNVTKPRGSGSPFKCIGLGLAQQIKSEKDEELVAARLQIEELQSLAVNRQKEIFSLNARLAAAESMTHDVIRDLLGVKLDMTNYVSLLDNQQVQKITEKVQCNSLEPQAKKQDITKLKQQLNEFIEERRGWLEEIDRKQAELVAAQITLEKFCQQDQLLKTENEMLKMENVNHKKRIMELEGEAKKLSGQQNLQQRIHHHAKIKEENNLLRIQNEELSSSLSRVKKELAHYRASSGKGPSINFDGEQQLMNIMKETEDDRMQVAQKLLGLCTSILKAAGISKPVSNITPAVAEEALEGLKSRITSLERELQDLTYKNKIASERLRLSELMPQASPINSRAEENSQTPTRGQFLFLSSLDR